MILIDAVYVLPWLINLDVVGLVVIEDNYGTNVGNYFKVIIYTLAGLPGHDEVCETDLQPPADQLGLFHDMIGIVDRDVVHIRHVSRGTRTLPHLVGRGAGLRQRKLLGRASQLPHSKVGCLSCLL